MIWLIIAILLALWLVGVIVHFGGALIHIVLVVAVVVFIINLLTTRRVG